MSAQAKKPPQATTKQPTGSQPQADSRSGDVSQMLGIQVAEALEKAAQAADSEEKLRLQRAAEFCRDRSSWELKEHWPDLFKLYRTESGRFVAILDERLAEIERQLRQGLNQSHKRVLALTEGLGAILFSTCQPGFVPPTNDEIPSLEGLQTSMQDVHQAAQRLLVLTGAPSIVFATLQRTFGAELKEVMELPADQRPEAAAALKKDVCTALDAFFSRSPDEVAHNNKAMLTTKRGDLKPFALLAIEEARAWVETRRDLPTKHQLHGNMQEKYPVGFPKERTWHKILKEAGLDGLPKKVPWK